MAAHLPPQPYFQHLSIQCSHLYQSHWSSVYKKKNLSICRNLLWTVLAWHHRMNSVSLVISEGRPVTSIIEWAQCFTQYIAIVGKAKPDRIPDLLGYQHLSLEAHLEYSGDGWAVYDWRFCQIAATRPGVPWAQRDGDLWYMVFSTTQRKPYCQHCFGSTHSSDQMLQGS